MHASNPPVEDCTHAHLPAGVESHTCLVQLDCPYTVRFPDPFEHASGWQ
jgi:hypothetical protein